MELNFHVSAAAKSYIERLLSQAAGGEPMVVVIVPEIATTLPSLEVDAAEGLPPLEQLVMRGKEFLASLTGPIVHQWTVGGAPKSRFPANDVHEIDGLYFYLPADMAARIDGRVLDVKRNALKFDPELEPFITQG